MEKKSSTTNLQKAGEWINEAVKSSKSIYFRFVSYMNGKDVRGEWLTPEIAYKEYAFHDEFNTLRVERLAF